MAGLKLTKICKSYGRVDVLRDIDLEVPDGAFVVFVGPSGCGKSTLLRAIAGLERATSGRIEIDGRDVTDERASERGLAMVFQSYALYPHMSVRQNIAFALENMRLPRAEIAARVARAAQMLRLEPYLDRKPGALSGGQRQRVAIGRAVVRDPKIFLFDEPLSNLDAELRVATRKELAALHAEIGGTMIYVTHDQVEAMTLADRIVVLNAGRIEQTGAPLDLYNRPENRFVAGFIGSPRMNFLKGATTQDGRIAAQGFAPIDAPVARLLPAGAACEIGIRPEHVHLVDAQAADATAKVELVERLGGESFLYVRLADGAPLTVKSAEQTPARRGDEVALRLDPAHLHLFDEAGRARRLD
ncbi:MAG: sn-glycerol-3-phosphate ABC transporter ATP-binding protein UgpC [Methylobacteriaceae bacterium]|nr:sn-glycerol-3-phosphate ABC transporter ATP-binding protein UgpC [Methylobacteriaceae bacterium]